MICTQDHTSPPTKTLPVCDNHTAALCSPQQILFVHLRLENEFPFFGNITSFALSLFLSRFPMRPSLPTPQGLRPVRHPSKFSPRTMHIRGTIQVRLSFQIDGFLTGPSQFVGDTQPMSKWNNRSFERFSKRLSYGVFPSDKRS